MPLLHKQYPHIFFLIAEMQISDRKSNMRSPGTKYIIRTEWKYNSMSHSEVNKVKTYLHLILIEMLYSYKRLLKQNMLSDRVETGK